MKTLLLFLVVGLSLNAFAVENKDVECSLTRYIPIIGADGQKTGGETKGIERKVLSWSAASDRSQEASVEIEGISLSASMYTDTCWDDDRQVECNRRFLMFYVYNRKDGSNVSTHYDLNSQNGYMPMSVVYMNNSGRFEISCKQVN